MNREHEIFSNNVTDSKNKRKYVNGNSKSN
jgi:hypothetical protein